MSYLRSSLSLFNQVTNSLGFDVDLANTPEQDVEYLLGRAYERYCASRALIGDESTAKQVVRLVEGLEDNDDVQDVYANFDIPETVLEAVAS